MPKGIHNVTCPNEPPFDSFVPLPHQEFVSNYIVRSEYRGLVLYHRLGSGKTCTAILSIHKLLQHGNYENVYILSPGSLRKNFIDEYCKKCGFSKDEFKLFTFITYNYDVVDELPESFDNSIVVIDEFHHVMNMVKNNSRTGASIYRKLVEADNCKILLLSGTPVYNNPVEFGLTVNLLKPGTFHMELKPKIVIRMDTLFDKNFRQGSYTVSTSVKKSMARHAIQGIVSYVPGFDERAYPQTIVHDPIKINMSSYQYQLFLDAQMGEDALRLLRMNSEKMLILRQKNYALYKLLEDLHIMAMQYIMTRSISNMAYPENVREARIDDYVKIIIPDHLVKEGTPIREGWITPNVFDGNLLSTKYSPKIAALLNKIAENFNGKHLVYSFFKQRGGVDLIHALLEKCGIKSLIYSGSITNDEQRASILRKFNALSNLYGDEYKVLLVTEAGGEGITLKAVQYVHILESDYRENKIQQLIGRAVRYKSHDDLPAELRKVHIYRYWASFLDYVDDEEYKWVEVKQKIDPNINNDSKKLIDESVIKPTDVLVDAHKLLVKTYGDLSGPDELLYRMGVDKMNLLTGITEAMKEYSIENYQE